MLKKFFFNVIHLNLNDTQIHRLNLVGKNSIKCNGIITFKSPLVKAIYVIQGLNKGSACLNYLLDFFPLLSNETRIQIQI